MERTQRIIELRQMFLELVDIVMEDIAGGKSAEDIEPTISMLKRIQKELVQLEKEREEENPIKRKSN